MGREVRMVPPGWEHPKSDEGYDIPLLKGPFSERLAEWDEESAQWSKGLRRHYGTGEWVAHEDDCTYEEYAGKRPVPEDYMPEFEPGTATHLMMYENVTEGTPISPAFATPEELARWLADNGASAFGYETATYEQWLSTCRRGFAPSAIFSTSGGIQSGVAALSNSDAPEGIEDEQV